MKRHFFSLYNSVSPYTRKPRTFSFRVTGLYGYRVFPLCISNLTGHFIFRLLCQGCAKHVARATDFVPWRLIAVGPHYETNFKFPFWCQDVQMAPKSLQNLRTPKLMFLLGRHNLQRLFLATALQPHLLTVRIKRQENTSGKNYK